MKRTALVVVVGLLAVLTAVGLYLRQGEDLGQDEADSSTAPTNTQPEEGAQAPTTSTVGDLTEQYLNRGALWGEPIAEAEGVVYGFESETYEDLQTPARLEILSLESSSASTLVRYVITADEQTKEQLSQYLPDAGGSMGSRVELAVPQADLLLTPGNWSGLSSDCTCTWHANEFGPDGLQMSALFPALPDSVTEAQLVIPGFEPLTAPVTRK